MENLKEKFVEKELLLMEISEKFESQKLKHEQHATGYYYYYYCYYYYYYRCF